MHALRLMASRLFDTHPSLQIVIGPVGEGLPWSMWRVDNCTAWMKLAPKDPARRPLGDHLHENVHITTSGKFRTQAVIDARLEAGADRETIGRGDARRLFGLDQASS